MNDDNKILDQVQPQTPVQPVSSAGGANKEVGRVAGPVSEFVTRSGAEIVPNIPPEVSKHVEVKSDSLPLTEEHREIGMYHSGASVPAQTAPTGLVEISEKKDTNINNSRTWRDWLLDKVDKVMKLKLLGA